MNHAIAPTLGTVSHQQKIPEESHLQQEPKKFVIDEHDRHLRHMDIRPSITDEDSEGQHVHDESIVSKNNPAVVTHRKFKPVQVLPDVPICSMTQVNEKGIAMADGPKTVAVPPQQGLHKDAKIPIAKPPTEWADSLPTRSRISTGAEAPNIPAVVATGPSLAKIPIAQPTQTDTAAARRRGSLPSSFHANLTTKAGDKDTSRDVASKPNTAAREAAPLMAAAATGVKPDDVVVMNAGDNAHSQHRNVAAPSAATLLGSAASFDPATKESADHKVKKHVRAEHDHDHDHGYGDEDKDLQEEKRDTLGELSPAQEYAATHKSSLPTVAGPDAVTPEVLQRQQQRSNGTSPTTATNTSAPTAAQPTTVLHDTRNEPKELPPVPVQTQFGDQHLNKPLPNPQASPEGKTATTTAPAAPVTVPAGYEGPVPKVREGEQIVWVKKTTVEEVHDDDNLPPVAATVPDTARAAGNAETSGKGSDEHHKDNLLHRIAHKLTGRRKSADPHPYHSTQHHQQGDNAVHGRRGPAQ